MRNMQQIIEQQPKLMTMNMEDGGYTHLLRAMHMHDDRVEILLIRKGGGVHTVNGKSYLTKAGDILVYNAGVLHDEVAATKEGMDIFSCVLTNIKLFALPPNCILSDAWCPVIQDGVFSTELEALMALLYTGQMEPGKITEEMSEYLICALVLLVQRAGMQYASTPPSQEVELGHRIQAYIDMHYKESITLADIAEGMRLNQFYLSRVFKKTVGYSPMQYIIRRRIGESQSWLLETEKGVTDIAYLVGYNSASQFNNAFRALIGMTPQRYREHWKRSAILHNRKKPPI